MKVFLAACLAAIVLAVISAIVLNTVQEPVDRAFTSLTRAIKPCHAIAAPTRARSCATSEGALTSLHDEAPLPTTVDS